MAASRTPNRYQLPLLSMVGALVVVLGFIAVGRIWRAVTDADQGVGVQTVDYRAWLESARKDGRLAAYAPQPMPQGWRATSASYGSVPTPHWHLGVLTDEEEYVGLDESLAPIGELVDARLSESAERTGRVTIDGVTWQTWTDPRGDYALSRALQAPGAGGGSGAAVREHLLVGGSAPPEQIRSYAASLRPGR